MRGNAAKFTPEERIATAKRAVAGEKVADLAKELKTHDSVVYKWKRDLILGVLGRPRKAPEPKTPAPSNGKPEGRMDLWVKGERAQLLQLIGEQAVELVKLKARR